MPKMNGSPPVPKCGTSDKRNVEYEKNYSPKRFFDNIISTQSPTIFDVGAHRGESIQFFKDLYPDSEIFSFEPEPNNYAALLDVAKSFYTHAYNCAIGDADENASFFRQDISHLGGLLPINCRSSDSLGYAKNASNERIEVSKVMLDTFCKKESIPNIDILKIDVQGFEVGVLKGARYALSTTECVMVEISLYDFYESAGSSLLQVEQLMNESGFMLWDISKLSKNPKNLRTDWVEVVYRKNRPVQLLSET